MVCLHRVREMEHHYTKVIRDILMAKDWTYAALSRKLKVSRVAVSTALRDENPRSGMTMDNFVKYVHALGGKIYVEWEDEGDGRRRYRWEVGNVRE